MRISDWSSDVCSSDLANQVIPVSFPACRTPSSRHAAARVPAHPMAGLVTGSRFPTCEQRACGDPMNAISEDLARLPETAYRAGPWIDFDPQAFDSWRIMAVRHHLSGHPLLQLDELLALGGRLEARGSIRSHASGAKPGTPFNSAPELFPNPKSATDTLRAVAEAKAWTSLLNVQIDPTYRALVGEVLESVRPRVEAVDPGMCHRGGWIFITSPNTVTPFHFDKEHNLDRKSTRLNSSH